MVVVGGGGQRLRKWASKSNSQFCLLLPDADGLEKQCF